MLRCTAGGTVLARSALPCQQQAPQTSVGRCLLLLLLQAPGAGLEPAAQSPLHLQPGVQHLWLRHPLHKKALGTSLQSPASPSAPAPLQTSSILIPWHTWGRWLHGHPTSPAHTPGPAGTLE